MKVRNATALALCAMLVGPALVPADAEGPAVFERFTTREISIPAGVRLPVVMDTSVASNTSRVEQPVQAHLSRNVLVDNEVVIPAGSMLYGNVTSVRRPGKVKGLSHIGVRFTTLVPKGGTEKYRIETAAVGRTGRATKKKDAMKIGIPAAGGAVVGALLGGKKGAGIGAGVAGGAGTAVVLSTRGEEVGIARGTPLTLRVTSPLTVRVAK